MDNDVSASYKLHVYDGETTPPIFPTGAETSPMTLKVGEFDKVPVKLLPADRPIGLTEITFEVADPTIVELTEESTGIITALKPGTTTVTISVTSPYEEDEEPIVTTCEVTVTGESEAPSGAANTGTSVSPALWAVLLGSAAIAAVVLLRRRKK